MKHAYLSLVLLATACGSRSELRTGPFASEPTDADVPNDGSTTLPPPQCDPPTAVGEIRFSLTNSVGGAAVDRDGNIYVPTTTTGALAVTSLDPCGFVRWLQEAFVGQTRGGHVRLTSTGEVLLVDVRNAMGRVQPPTRLSLRGNILGRYTPEQTLARTLLVPNGRGAVLATVMSSLGRNHVEIFDAAGRFERAVEQWSNVNECAAQGNLIACMDRAYDLSENRVLWSTDNFELIDGTLRHVTPPALDGDRLYALIYGVRTYVLVAREARTGRELWRTTAGLSSLGQTGLMAGEATVGPDGAIWIYLNINRDDGADGQLQVYERSGTLRWSFAANANRQVFDATGTHVVAADGSGYLAVRDTVYSLDASGRERWRLTVNDGLSHPELRLSPTGDLLVHTDGNRLLGIATESPGIAARGWPMSGGDMRNANAR